MEKSGSALRVLYSFPHKIGADRICYTAWNQVNGLAAAGAAVSLHPGVVHRPLPGEVAVFPTLARGRWRIPYKLIGMKRACAWHDYLVSKRLERLRGQIDIVHAWPLAAKRTLQTAARLGIPTVLERPNAHTRFAYEVVRRECERIGVPLPPGHEHAYNPQTLALEEEEYRLADALLCPSDFVAKTFRDEGFEAKILFRHIYGFDQKRFYPAPEPRVAKRGLTMISVGVCAVRKGLHFALEAWLKSPASQEGTFLIAGGFIPEYHKKLAPLLAHPSIKVLGHRTDVPELMRQSDLLVLSSIEEGSALATSEGRGSGCVILVSEAAGAYGRHLETALVHGVGDVEMLSRHITLMHEDRALLEKLRAASLSTVAEITWPAAGVRLLQVYREVIAWQQQGKKERGESPVQARVVAA